MSDLEDTLLFQLRALGIPEPVREYRFTLPRRWRFDFAWPEWKLVVEVEGGTWSRSRHTTGAGFEKDAVKYNTAAEKGWLVFRYTSGMIASGEAATQIEHKILGTAEGGRPPCGGVD